MFVSVWFLLFLTVVVTVFFFVPQKLRAAVLLVASYAFCGFLSLRGLGVLFAISAISWFVGLHMEHLLQKGKRQAAKAFWITAICLDVFLLCAYKYIPYFLQRFSAIDRLSENMLACLLMPLGLSFYSFQAIGYLTDIYLEKADAEKSFLMCNLYFGFFAKLVSGPIERRKDFLSQLKNLETVRFWDRGRLSTAFTYMLWGYFMKMVVADRLAVLVNTIFQDVTSFDSFWLVLGAFFYTIQIYCDFAGYSYIAIGVALIFGLQLTQNFFFPYCAESVSDFWRRWHISLSSWLRDYLYIPLGGNRKGLFRKCRNYMVVFIVCGMWHGAGLNFLVWGLLHGCFLTYESIARAKKWKLCGGRVFTFLAVAFAWIFFRASSLRSALEYIFRMLTVGLQPQSFWQSVQKLQLNAVEIGVIIIGVAVVWAIDRRSNRQRLHFPFLVQGKKSAIRYLIFYLLIIGIFIFGMYGPGYHAEQFIYMQF